MAQAVLEREELEALFNDGVGLGDVFTVLALAQLSVERLAHADPSSLTPAELRHFVQGVEGLRNQTEAATIDAAAAVEQAGHERELGYFSTKSWVRHHLGVSSADARARMQVVRLLDALPEWKAAARHGQLGVEQLRLAARTFALQTVCEAFIDNAADRLQDAVSLPFDRFEECLANLRRLADPDRERREAERRKQSRRLTMRRRPDGSWSLSGRFGDLQGAEINDLLAHYTDAEWRTDWVEASAGADGDEAVGLDALRRTQPQRRADALHQMVLAAASSSGDGSAPFLTLDVLIDHETLRADVERGGHDPRRYREMVCRTQQGDPIPISEASGMALYAHIRRVVLDGTGTVIDLGRRSRCFTGAAREAVMLTETTCIWFGCDAPVRRCEADHTVEWGRRSGTTSPDNGAPMCRAHNLLKERRRYLVRRRPDGGYDITTPDGTPLG